MQCELHQIDQFSNFQSCNDIVDTLRNSLMPSLFHNWSSIIGVLPPYDATIPQEPMNMETKQSENRYHFFYFLIHFVIVNNSQSLDHNLLSFSINERFIVGHVKDLVNSNVD